MGQIIGSAAKPKRCNINQLSQLGTPAAGEYILVSSDNSMNAAGQGNFDCCIVGNGTDAATALPVRPIAANEVTKDNKNSVTSGAVASAIDWGDKGAVYTESTTQSVIDNVAVANQFIASVEFETLPEGYTEGSLRLKQIYMIAKETVSGNIRTRWLNQFTLIINGTAVKTYGFTYAAQVGQAEEQTVEGLTVKWNREFMRNYDASGTTMVISSGANASNPYKIYLKREIKHLDGTAIEVNSLPTDRIKDFDSAVVNTIGENAASVVSSITEDGGKQLAESVLSELGEKPVIIDMTGENAEMTEILNTAILRIEASGTPEYPKSDARLRQLYCVTPGGNSWQAQIAFYVEGSATLLGVVTFAFPLNVSERTNGIYTMKVDKDYLATKETGHESAFSLMYDATQNNPYGINFAEDNIYIGKEELSPEIINEIGSSNGFMTGKKLVTLCDSLGTAGTWQEKLVELTGCVFNQTLNYQHYSRGGTPSLGIGDYTGQERARMLVEENEIVPDIIFIENVNDSLNVGTTSDEPFFLSSKITLSSITGLTSLFAARTYWDNNFASIVGGLTPTIGQMLLLPFTSTAFTLTITSAPSAAGTLAITLGDSGTKYVNILATDTIANVVAKIAEYAYENYTCAASGSSVVFKYVGSGTPSIEVDAGATGITSTNTTSSTTSNFGTVFLGHDVSKWNTASQWKYVNFNNYAYNITLMSIYKGMVEYLQTNFPKAMIYFIMPKTYQFNWASYQRPDGTIDYDAVLANCSYRKWLFDGQVAFCEYYEIPYVDLRKDTCLTPANLSTFMVNSNVHPQAAAYIRWAEVIAQQIG